MRTVSLSSVDIPTGEPVKTPTTFHAVHVAQDSDGRVTHGLAVTTRGAGAAVLSRITVKVPGADADAKSAILREFLSPIAEQLGAEPDDDDADAPTVTVEADDAPDGLQVKATGRLTDWKTAHALGVVAV